MIINLNSKHNHFFTDSKHNHKYLVISKSKKTLCNTQGEIY